MNGKCRWRRGREAFQLKLQQNVIFYSLAKFSLAWEWFSFICAMYVYELICVQLHFIDIYYLLCKYHKAVLFSLTLFFLGVFCEIAVFFFLLFKSTLKSTIYIRTPFIQIHRTKNTEQSFIEQKTVLNKHQCCRRPVKVTHTIYCFDNKIVHTRSQLEIESYWIFGWYLVKCIGSCLD